MWRPYRVVKPVGQNTISNPKDIYHLSIRGAFRFSFTHRAVHVHFYIETPKYADYNTCKGWELTTQFHVCYFQNYNRTHCKLKSLTCKMIVLYVKPSGVHCHSWVFVCSSVRQSVRGFRVVCSTCLQSFTVLNILVPSNKVLLSRGLCPLWPHDGAAGLLTQDLPARNSKKDLFHPQV